MKKHFLKNLLLILLFVIASSCNHHKSKTVVIVDGEKIIGTGKVNVTFTSGGYQPNFLVKGAIVIFKTDGSILDQQGYAGKVYKLDSDLDLREITTTDINLTNDKLIDKFLISK